MILSRFGNDLSQIKHCLCRRDFVGRRARGVRRESGRSSARRLARRRHRVGAPVRQPVWPARGRHILAALSGKCAPGAAKLVGGRWSPRRRVLRRNSTPPRFFQPIHHGRPAGDDRRRGARGSPPDRRAWSPADTFAGREPRAFVRYLDTEAVDGAHAAAVLQAGFRSSERPDDSARALRAARKGRRRHSGGGADAAGRVPVSERGLAGAILPQPAGFGDVSPRGRHRGREAHVAQKARGLAADVDIAPGRGAAASPPARPCCHCRGAGGCGLCGG